MQCHLETTSLPLPHSILRYDRRPFSYRPGEPLSGFEILFDRAPASKPEDKFEIVSSVYRLRNRSASCKARARSPALRVTIHTMFRTARRRPSTTTASAASATPQRCGRP